MKKGVQKGKSKILLIVVAVVVLVGAGGAYLLSQKTGMSIPGMKAALNPNCKYNDPDLCKFLNNWQVERNYAVTSSSNFGGMTIESRYEIAGQDKFHMISKQNGKENSNMITIGDTSYTLDYTDNKWWKQTYKADETETTSPDKEMKDQFNVSTTEDTTTYKLIGKEACGALTCFRYQIDAASAQDSKQFLLFDDQDYLLRKMIIESGTDGAMEAFYSYDNITITVPSPVKEGAPGPDAGAAGGYNKEEVQKMMQQYQQQAQEETTDLPQDDPAPAN